LSYNRFGNSERFAGNPPYSIRPYSAVLSEAQGRRLRRLLISTWM
jgi:hypothetical protein